MSVASALATGYEASPRLVETAVGDALDKAGLERANGVILFLSSDYARGTQAAHAVLAAARSAGCLQVFGTVAPGLFTDAGWVLDRPAAAVLVLGSGLALAPDDSDPRAPRLGLAAGAALPPDWRQGPARFGLMQNDSPLWQGARLAGDGPVDTAIHGARCHVGISTGLRRLEPDHAVDEARGHDLVRVDGLPAAESLARALPAETREHRPFPFHVMGITRGTGEEPAIPILSANGDGSLTLAERLRPGERISWTLRQPVGAEADMRRSLELVASGCPQPEFALMFSCIGRGPLFYGDDDRDLAAFRARFPGVPLLGAYGSSQIAPVGQSSRQWQNSVVTALFETDHVQPFP